MSPIVFHSPAQEAASAAVAKAKELNEQYKVGRATLTCFPAARSAQHTETG